MPLSTIFQLYRGSNSFGLFVKCSINYLVLSPFAYLFLSTKDSKSICIFILGTNGSEPICISTLGTKGSEPICIFILGTKGSEPICIFILGTKLQTISTNNFFFLLNIVVAFQIKEKISLDV